MVVRRGARGGAVPVTHALAMAYSLTGGAWQDGPGRLYDRLADVLLSSCPVPLEGCRVLDVGAGTGAASRAALAAGAREVVAVDAAIGMLTHMQAKRPPATAGDALALPFAASTFDVAVAAFSLNHLTDPARGLREMARATRHGGAIVIASFATEDDHPAKGAVESALVRRGWEPEPWYTALCADAVPLLATVEGCRAAATGAGLDAIVEVVQVRFPELRPVDLVRWRLGMAQHAPFVAALPSDERERVVGEALEVLEALDERVPLLVRSMLVLSAITP